MYFYVRNNLLWLDGYSLGDNKWFTHGFRKFDQNFDPTLMSDFSSQRTWFSADEDSQFQVFNPNSRHFPITLNFPHGFCDKDSSQVFVLTGKFLNKVTLKSPQIIFKMNRTTEVFHWDFRLGLWSRE